LAQELPISESSTFVYDRQNYGNDFLNAGIPFSNDPLGAIWCQPYGKEYIQIGNTSSTIPIADKNKSYPYLQNVFRINGHDYYCTNKSILVADRNKLIKKFLVNKDQEFAGSFKRVGAAIYYLNVKYFDNPFVTINTLDGAGIATLQRFYVKDLVSSELIEHKGKLYLFINSKTESLIYSVAGKAVHFEKRYQNTNLFQLIFAFKDVNNFAFLNGDHVMVSVKDGIYKKTNLNCKGYAFHADLASKAVANQKFICRVTGDRMVELANSSLGDSYVYKLYSKETNSYYCGTNGSLLRLFPHIKKYPRLFYNNNSNSVFTLQQDDKGQIWAGSYQGTLSIITNEKKAIQSKTNAIKFLNGGTPYKDKMLLIGESGIGLLQYENIYKYRPIANDVAGYCTYISKSDKLYMGTMLKGLWYTDLKSLSESEKIKWEKITNKHGLAIENILTICEDRFGSIWYGGGSGIGVYNPNTKLCTTWKRRETKPDFLGTMAMLADTNRTVWIGAKNGNLLYYNDKNEPGYSSKNFVALKHPLLEGGKPITFIHQWNQYLVIGAGDKVLLFDLKKWYANETVAVRYLNPMEMNLTSGTEQNTILTDRRDQSIWFASSDMVYQWDIRKWLELPTFTVDPSILIKKDSTQAEFKNSEAIAFKATENSFDIEITYQTKDNMPRFVNGVMTKKGDLPVFETPNLQTKFQFKNLSAGDYIFYVRTCQQDGSYSVHQFPICIDNFLWQKWWFWLVISFAFLGILIYFFQRRNEIDKQKKKLSQLNLSSLSNQFRPHFMLNALNSIGSQMQGKPHAEKVISRLGESINILYSFTQKNKFTLPFCNEWKLVENSIEIQRLLFIPDLSVVLRNEHLIAQDYEIPVGLLQIPVENALLHGLRNRTDSPCILEIEFSENTTHYFVTITDNGVGRENAAKINNFKKNGNGLKTITEMVQIINQSYKRAVIFDIADTVGQPGTKVTISLLKNIDYDKIKI